MWLTILIGAPVAIILHGHYFSRLLARAAHDLLPRSNRTTSRIRLGYLAITYSVPALILFWILYVLVIGPESNRPPVHWMLDYGVMMPFWLLTLYSVQCTLLIAPVHFAQWTASKLGVPRAARWERRRHVYALVVAGIFLVYLPARVALDRSTLQVRNHEVVIENLPDEFEGFTIALLSDPQADQYTTEARLTQLVDETNRQQPELVLIAGDIITGAPEFIDTAARVLGQLRARHGVVSSIGDHENFAYRDRERSVREIRDALTARGVAMLDDEVYRVDMGSRQLAVIVATHNYITPIQRERARALVAGATDADVRMVLAHQTGEHLVAAARDADVDLYLSGHTHGGQVRLWWLGQELVPARLETPYITGRYSGGALGAMDLIVSSGLGVSVLPFRYRAPATIDMVTLRGSSSVR